MAKGAINVQITGDYTDKDIKRAIKDLESLKTQAAPTSKSMGGITTAFKGMALAAGAFVGISAVKDFMGDAIQQGSALEESLSKVNVVFGKSADEIVAWSESSASAFGQSQAQALESVGTFGNLLQAFGSTASEAQVMSQRMVELAADLASFNNTSVEDALQAIQSGLSGETEPLKKFGVALNDARLKTVALEKGLYSGKGTLDVYAKSIAAYELILQDTTLAQGDFARTSDGFANQMRIIQASVDDAKAEIGSGLLVAINSVVESLGGADGLQSMISGSAEDIANFIVGVSDGVQPVLDLAAAIATLTGIGQDSEQSFIDQVLAINKWLPGGAAVSGLYERLIGNGEEVRLTNDRINDSLRGSEALYAGYAASLDDTAAATRQVEADTAAADDALKAFKDEVNAFKQSISDRQSLDDFRKGLADLGETLKDNKTSFNGMGDAAYENRQVIRDMFSDAADQAQSWVDSGKISADEFQAAYSDLGSDIVDAFVEQGFTRKEIRKFLKDEGLWTAEFNKVGDYAKAAGVQIGKDLIDGLSGSINSPSNLATLRYAAMQAAAIPEQVFKDVYEISSPSKLMQRNGVYIIQGLIDGMASKKDDLKARATDVSQGVIDAAQEMVDGWDTELQRLGDLYDDALTDFNNFKNGIATGILGDLDLGAAIEEADKTGGSVVDAFKKQADGIGTFAQQMIELTKTNLSQSAWQAVAELGAARGSGIAAEMLSAQGATTIEGINQVYADVETMANAVGDMAAKKWYGEGVKNAQATYEGFKANFGEGGPARKALMNLMDRLSNAMNRSATITVTTINRTISQTVDGGTQVHGATGGIVNRPTFALIGEAGPEAVIPLNRTPGNSPLPTASGGFGRASNVTITVNAGMGTNGAEVGRQIVDALKSYERRNGAVYVAA